VNMRIDGLAVRSQGPSTAPTIVFLHGGGVGDWSWDPVVERLTKDYHCPIPDLSEHGQSWRTIPFSINDSAHRVASLITQEANGGQATVVSLSLGAQVGLALLESAPLQVAHDPEQFRLRTASIALGCLGEFGGG
jgi:pimeloyl-ACP methyl ester carboxylesterase